MLGGEGFIPEKNKGLLFSEQKKRKSFHLRQIFASTERVESTINGRQKRCLLGTAGGIKSDYRLKAACGAKAICTVEKRSFNLPLDASQPFFHPSCCLDGVYVC